MLHFALPKGINGNITWDTVSQISLRDVFDVPELSNMNDIIVDGLYDSKGGKSPFPCALYSVRLSILISAFGLLPGDLARAS